MNFRERRLTGPISSHDGRTIGGFFATVCESHDVLFSVDHFACEDLPFFSTLAPPVAYLRKLKIDSPKDRHLGFGSIAMTRFVNEAIRIGAKSALARISDPESPKEVLVAFYVKNGWKILPDGKDAFPRFATLQLTQ